MTQQTLDELLKEIDDCMYDARQELGFAIGSGDHAMKLRHLSFFASKLLHMLKLIWTRGIQ